MFAARRNAARAEERVAEAVARFAVSQLSLPFVICAATKELPRASSTPVGVHQARSGQNISTYDG